jgi:hypothetical protein
VMTTVGLASRWLILARRAHHERSNPP